MQKKVKFGKRIARAQFSLIIDPTLKKRKAAYFTMKNGLEFADLCDAADFVDKNFRESYKELMYGNPLPQSYRELGKCNFSYVTDFFVKEINWALIAIRKYTYEVNLFLAYKAIYEDNLIIGNYEEAERYLTKIENEICFSLWSLENRFLLNEYKYSSLQNKEFLSLFNEENESFSNTKYLAHYLSIRAEKTLSVNRFNNDLESSLRRIRGDHREKYCDYYLFKLSFLNNINYTNYTEIVGYDFYHSIIDRYLNIRKVLSNLLTTANQMLDNVENGREVRKYVLSRINYLIKKIDDPFLFKLKLFASDKIFPAFNISDSKHQIGIIDKYTTGLYSEVQEDLEEILLLKPTQFDLYDIYIKSLVYQRKKFSPIGQNPISLQNQILSEMHKIVSVSSNPIEAEINLLRIANNITSCTLSYGITDFVFFQTKGKMERKLLARLSYDLSNPIIYEIYPNLESQIEYLELLRQKFTNSITIDFLSKKIKNIDSILSFEDKIPEVKYKTEYAKALQAKGDYRSAVDVWHYLLSNHRETIPVLQTAVRNLYKCYEELKEYDNCISLYVDQYFNNEHIIEKIETEAIIRKIREDRFRNISPMIELPIFYTIINADENETHTAFERFNFHLRCCKPSELIGRFSDFDRSRILFFFKYTCGQEILKHSIYINGSKERLEERLAICQFLKSIDPDSKSFYEDEIKSISNILIIQQGRIELDESKIYVNEQGIISNELKDYEAIFTRFKTIADISKKKKVFLLKKGVLTDWIHTNADEEVTTIEYSLNPVYDIYRELFDAIKEKFLYSKFGIVAYLSTRIRHGVLLGEIRPVFEKHKLITHREGDSSNYRRNDHWESQFNYDLIAGGKIQSLLRDFSNSVDGLIYDIIKKHLQVRDEVKNPDGWFDFEFKDHNLFWLSIRATEAKDFNQFVKGIFEILWDRTDGCLDVIRTKINNEIASQFNDLFDSLEKDILDVLPRYSAQPMITAIKLCSTEVQMVINRISNWFKRSGTQISDFNLEHLIDIVLGYSDKTNRLNVEKDIDFKWLIKGEYYTHFADLLRIFIENILKHSDENIRSIDAKICVSTSDEFINITIENTVTDIKSIQALKNVGNGQTIDISKLLDEGKSGFHKAQKILTSDLGNDANKFVSDISSDEDKLKVAAIINFKELINYEAVVY